MEINHYHLMKDVFFVDGKEGDRGYVLKDDPPPYQVNYGESTVFIKNRNIDTFANLILSSNSENISKFLRGDKNIVPFYILENDFVKGEKKMFYSRYIAKPDVFISEEEYMKLPD